MSEVQNKLAAKGVFAGLGGLEGLLNATEFWAQQPYGTRLYYGSGGGEYLHVGVLRAAIEILREPLDANQSQEIEHLKAKFSNLQARLKDVIAECEATSK